MNAANPESDLGDAVDAALTRPADELVAAYFQPDGPFAAFTFDTLGCNDPFKVGTDDLLALTLLDVMVPARAVRSILEKDSETISERLAEIPISVTLWDATDGDVAAAESLWQVLVTYEGVAEVMAGKLLARKRPQLIPIFDDVVRRNLPAPRGRYWVTLKGCLDDERVARIEQLRHGLSPRISTLRLLDVAVWMRFSDGKHARRVQEKLNLTVAPRPPRAGPSTM